MEKLVYVIWRPAGLSAADFRERMLGDLAGELARRGARKLAVSLADPDVEFAAAARLSHLDPPIAGLVSFWLEDAFLRFPLERALAAATQRAAGYLVCESVPTAGARTAPPGERAPGVDMVSLLEKPDRLSSQAWFHHWDHVQRQVAIETQCTTSYVRNAVLRPLTEGAPPWRGIVEEGFPGEAVLDPMLWYRAEGSRQRLEANRKRMIESCAAFLDLDRVESHPMSRYVF